MDRRGEFFSYDPMTGIEERYEETPDGKFHIHTYQDVQPYLDRAMSLRNEEGPDEAWKERGCTMYADIPLSIVGDMMKRGINIFDPNDLPKVISEVNSTYSRFKTTYKHHELKNR